MTVVNKTNWKIVTATLLFGASLAILLTFDRDDSVFDQSVETSQQSATEVYTDTANEQSDREVVTEVYTDTANSYQVSFSEEWQFRLDEHCCGGDEPDWTKFSRPVYVYPKSTPHEDIYVFITPSSNQHGLVGTTLDEIWQTRNQDQFNSYERLSVNGFLAIYNYLDYVGPDNVEAYKKHTYYVQLKESVIELSFTEWYRHDWNPGSEFDAREYKDDFESIVFSIAIPNS